MSLRRASLLAIVLALSSCAAWNRVVASPAEYEAYRATRTSYTVEDRLAAAERYLDQYPNGRFASEVRARFDREDQAFYDRSSVTEDGLEWYLHVVPNGPHAATASLRLAELAAKRREENSDQLVATAHANERRLAKAAASRKRFVDLVVGVVTSLAATTSWGKPTWELPGDVLEALRAGENPGRCDDVQCMRVLTPSFFVPIAGGGLEERATAIELRLALRNGGVVEASLRGPALFSRLWEAERGQPLQKDEETARAEAVGFGLDLIAGAFEAVAPAARCDRPIRPPVVLDRSCGGWTVRVTVGDSPAEDDVLVVRGPTRE